MKFIQAISLPLFIAHLTATDMNASSNAPSIAGGLPDRGDEVAASGHDLDLHRGFVQRAQRGDLKCVFLGDSFIASMPVTAKDIWDKEIVPLDAAAFGIDGNTSRQLLWRVRNGEVDGYSAQAVVVNIGGNDLKHGDATRDVVRVITAIVNEIKKRQPQTQIFLIIQERVKVPPITPAGYFDRSVATDRELVKLDDGRSVHVVDLSDGMNKQFMGIMVQILMTGDAHKAHIPFEICWTALKSPLVKIFATGP